MYRWLLCGFVGLLALGQTPARAAINFDPDGALGATPVIDLGIFDWAPGNVLNVDGNTAVNDFVTSGGTTITPFNFFYQARLSSTQDSNGVVNTPGNIGAGGPNELTVVVGLTSVVTGASGVGPGASATFSQAPVAMQTVNYMEIWFDPTRDASDLQGTGFNGYAGAVPGGAAGNGTNATAGTSDSDAILVLSGQVLTEFASFNTSPPISNLDSFGADNYPVVDTVTGLGASNLVMDIGVLYFNPDFFPGLASIDQFTFTTQFGDPFSTVNPSARFLTSGLGIADGTAAGAVSAGVTPSVDGAGAGTASLGTINGGDPSPGGTGGPDFQQMADGSATLVGTLQPIPEPSSLTAFAVLAACGLACGGIRRLRRRS